MFERTKAEFSLMVVWNTIKFRLLPPSATANVWSLSDVESTIRFRN